jgi:hypothetical protein
MEDTFRRLHVTAALLLVAGYLAYLLLPRALIDRVLERRYRALLWAALVLLGALLGYVAVHRFFDRDELEHAHATWYVWRHHVPFRDFFERHHPLLWYLLVPFLGLFGETVTAIVGMRFAMLALTLGIVALTGALTREVTRSREAALVACFLLLTMPVFTRKSMEVRPDVPQVFFGLLSVYFLAAFLRLRETALMAAAGGAAGLSLAFLQKSLFLYAWYGLVFLVLLARRQCSPAQAGVFLAASGASFVALAAHLVATGSVGDYLTMNWLLNAYAWPDPARTARAVFRVLEKSLTYNLYFWVAGLGGAVWLLVRKGVPAELRAVSLLGLMLVGLLFTINAYPHLQYFLFAVPVLSVVAGHLTVTWFARYRLSAGHRLAILGVLALVSLRIWFTPFGAGGVRPLATHALQRARIEFVLAHTGPGDVVYSRHPEINVFRRDPHYFWFAEEIRDRYVAMTGGRGRHGAYDLGALIRDQRPAFLLDPTFPAWAGELRDAYQPTPYDGLYRRVRSRAEPVPRRAGP